MMGGGASWSKKASHAVQLYIECERTLASALFSSRFVCYGWLHTSAVGNFLKAFEAA